MFKKVAFVGSTGCGKTTLINSLSAIEPLNTDVASTEDIGKPNTTVAIDYGQVQLNEHLTLALYGVPGQKRFSFLWDYVGDGLTALVAMVKHNDTQSLQDLGEFLQHFGLHGDAPESMACAIAVTHCNGSIDAAFQDALDDMQQTMKLALPVHRLAEGDAQQGLDLLRSLIILE